MYNLSHKAIYEAGVLAGTISVTPFREGTNKAPVAAAVCKSLLLVVSGHIWYEPLELQLKSCQVTVIKPGLQLHMNFCEGSWGRVELVAMGEYWK